MYRPGRPPPDDDADEEEAASVAPAWRVAISNALMHPLCPASTAMGRCSPLFPCRPFEEEDEGKDDDDDNDEEDEDPEYLRS